MQQVRRSFEADHDTQGLKDIFLSEGSSVLSFRLHMECECRGKAAPFPLLYFSGKRAQEARFYVNKILPSTVQTKSPKPAEANMHANGTRWYSLMISTQLVLHGLK